MIAVQQLDDLIKRERGRYADRHPASLRAFDAAGAHLLGGVPMTWMRAWPGGFPLYLATAHGARLTDLDGNEFIDFCLGDTGAMAGHSPPVVQDAVNRRFGDLGGATAMLPTVDAAWVAGELTRRFGATHWSFTLSATDANRWALRLARQLTGRPKVAVFSYCYHGSVDESFVVATPDGARSREGNTGAPVDPAVTTRVVEFNDIDALERELATGDVAVLLMEPALTNIGIVLPEPGYLAAVREVTRAAGTLLINDETHTFSAGPGGCTKAWSLDPDIVTIGKAIGGGIPTGAYGLSAALAERIMADESADLIDTGGVGGTLAGNALSVAAMRATLEQVLTDEAFEVMIGLADRFTAGVNEVISSRGVPWTIAQLGARAEYRFCPSPPRSGGESNAAADPALDEYLHLYLANRGVLITPFHNMALMCPATTEADVDAHTEVFGAAVDELLASYFPLEQPMRFAVKTRPEHQTWKEIRDLWVAADQIELFESAWNWDHFYPLTGDTTGPNFEGWTMLAAMAEATSRIRIGCQVSGMIYRHPAVLANMAATINVISGGRLELGVGAGWNQQECDAYGIDLPPLRERFDRFDEGVEAMVGLLSNRTTTFEGRYVKLTDAYCEPKPVQRPHPPITIGGRGKTRTLKTTARFAQQWNAIAADPADWLSLKQVLVEHCAAIGRDPAEITCSVNVRMDSGSAEDLDAVAAASAAYAEAGADLIILGLPLHASPDLLGPLAERVAPLAGSAIHG